MVKKLLKDQRGFGVKEIAVGLGFIVVVGLVIGAMQGGLLEKWLEDVWGWVTKFINDNITT